ncbi:MAG TPA: aldehyde ferredoxin oxidoreductase C-terminal domain-containing protein [Atribacterota bacterium]|nr:aldehyde ferredoxin oxidoreductase C-terminal domain-containing protein [Atribacterota bacterium]
MIKGGYRGKILRVDLTKGSITVEDLPEESILRKYVGNFGLGLWYLMKELPDGVGPLEPENPLIFLNGPLVGTRVPCPTNCTITTLNADTKFTAGRSHTHGWFGPFISRAGYDGIIVNGTSDKWVYLWIDNDKVELRDATKFLGKDTHETEDLIKEDLGVNKKIGTPDGASVAAIGPAGEHLCAGASIMNDKNHGFCHSGVGAIMGSKHLKAIAVRGTGEVPVFDAKKLALITKDWTRLASKVGLFPIVGRGGVPKSEYKGVKELVGISSKNWTVNDIPGFGDRMSKQKITPLPCYRCPVACCYNAEPLEGPYKGYIFSLSGGGENQEGAASIVGVGDKDPGEVWYLTDLEDRLGFDTSTVGCAMAVAFEAYEKGLLTTKDTDGLELKWGDVKVIETLVRRIANKEGKFAQILAGGPKLAAQHIGLSNASVDVKGAGINIHDWRRAWGVLLGQIVGGGAGWPAPGADCWTPEADAGYPEKTDPLNPYGKGKEVAKTGIIKFWNDCYGCCWFGTWGVPGIMSFSSGAIAAVVGWEDFTPEEALAVGHRTLTLERIFNMMHGLTVEDDIKVSPRLTDPAPADAGPAAGKGIASYLEGWVRDYYEELGWDRKAGKPLRSTLKKLGLEKFIPFVWGVNNQI